MSERATFVAYDEDTLVARVVWHRTGVEQELPDVLLDDPIPPGSVVNVERSTELSEVTPTGVVEQRVEGVAPRKGSVRLGDVSVALGDLVAGLNTARWTDLRLGGETFAHDGNGGVLYVVGIGDLSALAAWIEEIEEWVAAVRAAIEAEEKRRALEERRQSRDRIVNPYTYVELPPEGSTVRGTPPSHDRLAAGHLAGRIQVTWEARSPILVGGAGDDGSRFPRDPSGRPMVPGSGVKGAVRSLHEALCGSCLRVIDLTYVPTYRQPVDALAGNEASRWTIAVVDAVDDDGRPTSMVAADEVRWIRHDALLDAIPDRSRRRTGTRLEVDGFDRPGVNDRREILSSNRLMAGDGGEWVLLLSDARARPTTRKLDGGERVPAFYYAAVGRIGPPDDPALRLAGPDDATWRAYQRLADDSDDVRRARGGQSPQVEVEFDHNPPIGTRQAVTTTLAVGDVVWIPRDQRQVRAIKRAQVWRNPGEHPVRERVPASARPCDGRSEDGDDLSLCPSCQVFGSAAVGEVSTDDRRAEQTSYRGHVRVGPAVADPGTEPSTITRAPLSTPRPGSGQFSLAPDTRMPNERDRSKPLAQWGSSSDSGTPRQIRGRKFYWHGSSERHQHKAGANDTLATQVEVLPEGTTLRAELTFENLTPAQLGGLLAALDPALVLADRRPELPFDPGAVATHLGGGRPLGLGSVTPHLTLDVHDAVSRYGGGETPRPSVDDLVAAWIETVDDGVRGTWPGLAAALSTQWVNARQIEYPSLKFFKTAGGTYQKREQIPMVPLAPVTAADQTLVRVEEQPRRRP